MVDIHVVSSTFNGDTGIATITIDGHIPNPKGFDDPVVELFRPIRALCLKDVLFTILVNHKEESVKCTVIPSNNHGIESKEFVRKVKNALLYQGILEKYIALLEKFFEEPSGLSFFLEKVEQAEAVPAEERAKLYAEANEGIKKFVKDNNLRMPSMKKRPSAGDIFF